MIEHHHGHKIRRVPEPESAYHFDNGNWVYCDDGTPVIMCGDGPQRPCRKCGMDFPASGHDPCIADLPGVAFACCGHGIKEEAYVRFESGLTIRGQWDHVDERRRRR